MGSVILCFRGYRTLHLFLVLLFCWLFMMQQGILIRQVVWLMCMIRLWRLLCDSLIFYPFAWFCFNPSFVCVSIVDSWKSVCSCWLYCLVKRLSFKLWSVGLSWSSFGDCWNYWSLSTFIVTHWLFSLRGISLIISLRNVFLIISLALIKFPVSWD